MARPPRTAKTGIPVSSNTKRLERVATIRMLMSEGLYRGDATKLAYARDWKVSRETVDDYAREASRSIQLDVADDPGELFVRLAAMVQSIAADSVERVKNEVDDDGNTLVGKKGHMGHGAAVMYYQAALKGVDSMATLVGKAPAAFVPLSKRTEDGGQSNGRPVVNISVTLSPPKTPPPDADASVAVPASPSPPAPPTANAAPIPKP
jgi:hypothetical protein